tara:strand:+ start:551 stop:994 length:444 start_codon:yes stop_codon:yes gene_type:complete
MATLKFEIDCTKNGPKGHNMTEQPLDSLKPYLWRIDIKGTSEDVSMEARDPAGANFRLVDMTDVRMVQAEDDETQITIFFKAVIEFNLDFDPDDEYGGKYFEKLLQEAGWSVYISSDTIGLETSDGSKDNDSFDGIWDAVKVDLKKI